MGPMHFASGYDGILSDIIADVEKIACFGKNIFSTTSAGVPRPGASTGHGSMQGVYNFVRAVFIRLSAAALLRRLGRAGHQHGDDADTCRP